MIRQRLEAELAHWRDLRRHMVPGSSIQRASEALDRAVRDYMKHAEQLAEALERAQQ